LAVAADADGFTGDGWGWSAGTGVGTDTDGGLKGLGKIAESPNCRFFASLRMTILWEWREYEL
jgi:hypothetical protein